MLQSYRKRSDKIGYGPTDFPISNGCYSLKELNALVNFQRSVSESGVINIRPHGI